MDRVFLLTARWATDRGNELTPPSYGLRFGLSTARQEFWEDSPEGWPQR